jgi:hypothetical protein
MTTLSQIINSGTCLVFLDADPDPEGRLPTGMAIGCNKRWYKVFFEVDGTKDFEFVNSYPVPNWAKSDDFEEILLGGVKLAEAINKSEVDL